MSAQIIDFMRYKEERDQVELESLKEDLMNWMMDPNSTMETITFTVEDTSDD